MKNNYCIFLYSHSDYSDLWNLTFGQIKEHIDLEKINLYFCVDKLNDYKIDKRINIILYEDNLCYSERVLTGLQKIQNEYEYILFLHEDWVIVKNYNHNYVEFLVNIMKEHDISHIRSYKNYGTPPLQNYYLKDSNDEIVLMYIPNDAEYFISLQPGIWSTKMFIEIYGIYANRPNLLEIATNLNAIIRSKYQSKLFCENIKLSEDSLSFPHIHTIAYGKWELSNDSYGVLKLLLKKYKIDVLVRGVL
jgi:hypothetical protein